MGTGWTQDCTEGEEVELWGSCYSINYTYGLFLGANELTGEIPSEIGSLTSLNSLDLSNNQLTGEIPAEIGNLSNLYSLDLSDNQLTEEIPSENLNSSEEDDLEIPAFLRRQKN